MTLNPHLSPYTNINSKYIKELSVRAKTRKLSEQNIRENLHDFGLDNKVLLDIKLKAQATKGKIEYTLSKIKVVWVKDAIKKVIRQPTEWGKQHLQITYRAMDLYSEHIKKLLQLNNEKTTI